MTMNKKFGALVLCLLLSVSLLLGACGNAQAPAEEANGGTDAEYVVKVVDGSGNPYTSGVIVQFMKNGEKVALQTIDENGVELMDFVLSIASGKQTKTEQKGFREISIFKDGVVL